jgi:hypothetical protein
MLADSVLGNHTNSAFKGSDESNRSRAYVANGTYWYFVGEELGTGLMTIKT